jgi:aminomethyltransferase
MLKRTPLFEEHVKLGAKIVPFAGWEMPLSYKGILAEHAAVRSACGLFDIGHMGVIDIENQVEANGRSPLLDFIQYFSTNDAALLSPMECHYSIVCNENGGAIDDILVYRLHNSYRLVVNASNTDAIVAHLDKVIKLFKDASFKHRKDLAMISLQGPGAAAMVPNLKEIKRNHCAEWEGMIVSRTGYTGEDGFEFFTPVTSTIKVWRNSLSSGAVPCGLGCRDTLRLEAGLPLYGHEYNLTTDPFSAGYGWAVKLNKPDFIGKAALKKINDLGPKRKLVGLKLSGQAVPRQGFPVKAGEKVIGQVTSGTFSPTLKIPVALAYLESGQAVFGNKVGVEIRGELSDAVVTSKKLL